MDIQRSAQRKLAMVDAAESLNDFSFFQETVLSRFQGAAVDNIVSESITSGESALHGAEATHTKWKS